MINPKQDKIWVPIPVIRQAWDLKLKNAFGLFLVLKMNTNGTVHLNSSQLAGLKKHYYGSIRQSYHNHLNKLIDCGWVWINWKRKILHINSFAKVILKKNFTSLRVQFQISNINHIQVFMFSALISKKIIDTQTYERYNGIKHRRARQNGRSLSVPFFANTYSYYGLSTRTIKELTGLSTGSVSKYKTDAARVGFLRIKKHYQIISSNANDIIRIKSVFPDYAHRINIVNGKVAFQQYDEIRILLLFSRLSYRNTFRRLSKKLKQI